MLEYVEPSAGDVARFDQAHQRILVDHLTARRIYDVSLRPQQLEAARRQKVIGRRRMRTVDRDDVHTGKHLVEALPISGVELFLDSRRHPAAVVVMDLQTEGARSARHCLADPSHTDDAEPLAPDAVAEHPGWSPAAPMLVGGEHHRAFG